MPQPEGLPSKVVPAVRSFDYSVLAAEIAAEVRGAVDRVRAAHGRTIAAILDIGCELLAVKDRLGHGHFGAWLDAEFGWTERTARNYMAVAACFGDKSETVSVLPPATLYALASPSVPGEVREQVVTGLSSGDLKPEDVGELVRKTRDQLADAKRAEIDKRRRAQLSPKQRAKELAAEKRREHEEVDRLRREIVHDKLVVLLQARLGEEDRQWLAESAPDLRFEIQHLVRQVLNG